MLINAHSNTLSFSFSFAFTLSSSQELQLKISVNSATQRPRITVQIPKCLNTQITPFKPQLKIYFDGMDMDDDDDIMEVNLTGLDLNQEPTDQPIHRVARYGSLLNELETAHGRIEERIRQLEAVTARSRQRQRWRQSRNAVEVTYSSGVDGGLRSLVDLNATNTSPVALGCKRDSSHLVAKALEMDSVVKKAEKEGGASFYDCNICLELAKDPILTCCGHLFCWPCFYQVSHIDSSNKECPVCKGEVSESAVIPIYGNGDSEAVCVTELGLKIPPRPKAGRVESVRQQRVTQDLSQVPVSEAIRRIRIQIDDISAVADNQTLQQNGSRQPDPAESAGEHRVRIHQVSRVLSESAASLSSLSSALSNAERLVEDLESVINNRVLQGGTRALPVDVRPPQTIDVSGLPVGPSSSSSVRRRNVMSRNLDLDSRDPRQPRRRRLN